jgi:hypothetical protein
MTEGYRKYLAEKLLNMVITEMVIIFREGNTFQYLVTEQATATTIGMLTISHTLIMDKWLDPLPDENGNQFKSDFPDNSFKSHK